MLILFSIFVFLDSARVALYDSQFRLTLIYLPWWIPLNHLLTKIIYYHMYIILVADYLLSVLVILPMTPTPSPIRMEKSFMYVS